MLSASHWFLAQARFCGRTHLLLSPNSTTPTVQVIFRYLRPDAPVLNIHRIHSNCGHGDISAITLLILSLSGCSCVNILWYRAPVDMMIFRWSHQSYQSICQQHPTYSYPQVTLIYYKCLKSDRQQFWVNIRKKKREQGCYRTFASGWWKEYCRLWGFWNKQ